MSAAFKQYSEMRCPSSVWNGYVILISYLGVCPDAITHQEGSAVGMAKVPFIGLLFLLYFSGVVEDVSCRKVSLFPMWNAIWHDGLTHDRSISTLDATAVANVRCDASEGNSVFDAPVPPWLQATEHEEALFLVDAVTEDAELGPKSGQRECLRG